MKTKPWCRVERSFRLSFTFC